MKGGGFIYTESYRTEFFLVSVSTQFLNPTKSLKSNKTIYSQSMSAHLISTFSQLLRLALAVLNFYMSPINHTSTNV